MTTTSIAVTTPPPSLSGPLVLGHLSEFMRDPVGLILRGYREHGPIFGIRALHRRYVIMAGTEAMRFLAKSERDHFLMKPIYVDFDALFGATNSVISTDGDAHAALRKLFRPTMSRTTFEGRLDEFSAVTTARIDTQLDREHDLLRFCRELVFRQLASLMDMDALDPSEYYDDIVHAMHTALEVGVTRRWPKVVTYFPGFRRARDRSLEFGHRLARTLRDSQASEGLFPTIGRALEAGLVGENDVPMLALIPFFAGLDTVASSMAFMLAAVYRDPELVAKLRAEVDEASAAGPLLRADLPRIESAKTECIRRYPVTVVSIRRCVEPFEFGGHRVEAGTDVMFGISATLFMEEHFKDPFRFDPERFLGAGASLARGNAFTPFGVGAHVCLGTALADSQLAGTLATIVKHYDVVLPRGGNPIHVVQDPFPVPAKETIRLTKRR